MNLDLITPLILTFNEELNIERNLSKLTWAKRVVIVDSQSTDSTLEIIKKYPNAEVYQRKFDHHWKQWQFGLTQTGITTEWVLGLDADYVLTDGLIDELKRLESQEGTNGYKIGFQYLVYGERLVRSIYPPVTALFRRTKSFYEEDGHSHKIHVEGGIGRLREYILHDDQKPIERWFEAQIKYAKLESEKILSTPFRDLSFPDRIRKFRIFAPFMVGFYCVFLQGLWLQGRRGFFYSYQRTVAERMLSLFLLDHDLKRGTKKSSVET